MIVLDLCCDREHVFEGWFASAEAFDAQHAAGQVSCPTCGSVRVVRRPSAPYVNTRSSPAVRPEAPAIAAEPAVNEALARAFAMLRQVGRASEDVGERFAEEARRIHYGDAESRNIRGKASRDDVGELIDEGIMVLPLPPDEDVH